MVVNRTAIQGSYISKMKHVIIIAILESKILELFALKRCPFEATVYLPTVPSQQTQEGTPRLYGTIKHCVPKKNNQQ